MITNTKATIVRDVSRLAVKARRFDTGLFVVEGPQAVRELLQWDPSSVVDIFHTAALMTRHPDLYEMAVRSSATVDEVSEAVLVAMADTVTPQGIIAVAQLRDAGLAALKGARLVAICHEVRDPGNAGTIIRAADAAGADAVVLTGDSVDLHNPKLVRSTTGSMFHLPIIEHHNLQDVINAVRAEGGVVLAAALGGTSLLEERQNLAQPTAWLFGNEARGLDAESESYADRSVSVPLYGKAESLNLATAASVCLYESAFAQRQG